MRRTAALALLAFGLGAGCADPAPPPRAPAAESAPEAPPSAPLSAPVGQGANAPDEATRRATWQGRATVSAPKALSNRWQRALRGLDGRLVSIEHGLRTGQPQPREHLAFTVRLFGLDAEVDARISQTLAQLKLWPADRPLPEDTFEIEEAQARWQIDIGRFKAPEGQPREHRLSVQWRALSPTPDDAPKCRKPSPVELPELTPRWLTRPLHNESTRRRILSEQAQSPEARALRVVMLYHNGYAHDGHVGELAQAAQAAKLKLVEGSGARQRWQGERQTLSWQPTGADPQIGCTPRGPMLQIDWQLDEGTP